MLVDPATQDWSTYDDAHVWHSATAGLPDAIAEATRRGLIDTASMQELDHRHPRTTEDHGEDE